MRTLTRSFALGALLLLALFSLQSGGAAAQEVQAFAAPAALSIDAAHRATTGPIFAPGERVAFWYNLLDGSARNFLIDSTGTVFAQSDGTLGVTITADDWDNIPLSASSIVAFGTISGAAAVYIFTLPTDLDFTLRIDASHHATTSPIYTVNEQVVFWYNLADGSAAPLYSNPDVNPPVFIQPNSTLDFVFPDSAWATLPANVTSIVAHGYFSGVNAVFIVPR